MKTRIIAAVTIIALTAQPTFAGISPALAKKIALWA